MKRLSCQVSRYPADANFRARRSSPFSSAAFLNDTANNRIMINTVTETRITFLAVEDLGRHFFSIPVVFIPHPLSVTK